MDHAGECDRLTRDLAKIDVANTRVLDRTEQAGDPSPLLARLEARQAEGATLQRRFHDLGAEPERQVALPSAEELTAVSAHQIERLGDLLEGTNQRIGANRLLGEWLGTVVVWPDTGERERCIVVGWDAADRRQGLDLPAGLGR